MNKVVNGVTLRPAVAKDWATIRDICCKTGNSGDPIDLNRWPFFGELWVGPYQQLRPEWCLVAEAEDLVIGYLTGCPDTRRFEIEKQLLFVPRLIWKVLAGHFPANGDTGRFLKRSFRREKSPEQCFKPETHKVLRTLYPAHLHINLDASQRRGGIGRELMNVYFNRLRQNQVPGIHIFCGAKPVSFYERNGFVILENIEFGPARVPIFAMGLDLRAR